MEDRRSRVGSLGHILMRAFASMGSSYGGVTFPPDPNDEIYESVDEQPDLLATRAGATSVVSFDDSLLRSSSSMSNIKFPEKAVRRLRSSSSMKSLRNRFRKGGRLRTADVTGLSEIAEATETTPPGDDDTGSAVQGIQRDGVSRVSATSGTSTSGTQTTESSPQETINTSMRSVLEWDRDRF